MDDSARQDRDIAVRGSVLNIIAKAMISPREAEAAIIKAARRLFPEIRGRPPRLMPSDIPIDRREISVRLRHALAELRVLTIGELAYTSEQQFLGIRNCGEVTINEAKRLLAKHGLSFRVTDEDAGELR